HPGPRRKASSGAPPASFPWAQRSSSMAHFRSEVGTPPPRTPPSTRACGSAIPSGACAISKTWSPSRRAVAAPWKRATGSLPTTSPWCSGAPAESGSCAHLQRRRGVPPPEPGARGAPRGRAPRASGLRLVHTEQLVAAPSGPEALGIGQREHELPARELPIHVGVNGLTGAGPRVAQGLLPLLAVRARPEPPVDLTRRIEISARFAIRADHEAATRDPEGRVARGGQLHDLPIGPVRSDGCDVRPRRQVGDVVAEEDRPVIEQDRIHDISLLTGNH